MEMAVRRVPLLTQLAHVLLWGEVGADTLVPLAEALVPLADALTPFAEALVPLATTRSLERDNIVRSGCLACCSGAFSFRPSCVPLFQHA